jgi:Flp pilus assembly protein TadG
MDCAMRHILSLWISQWYRLAADRRGNVALMFGLCSIPLLGLSGIAIDYSVAAAAQAQLNSTADAAALAAVSVSGNPNLTTPSQTQAQQMFKSAVATMPNVTLGIVSLIPNPNTGGTALSVTVSYSATVQTTMSNIIGISSLSISGTASASRKFPKYLDFYVVVDTSGSMGIPTNAADQQLLIATNPDNPIEEANGYNGGCQFACHFAGYKGFTYTQTNNIPLKLNSVGSSVQALLSTATSSEMITNQYRLGIYPFIVNPIVAAPLSSDFTQGSKLQTAAGNLAYYLDQGTSNGGMGSGGTHFENLWSGLTPYLQTPGTGVSSTSTLPFIILVTDGVDNNQVYTPSNASWTGSQPQIPSQTFCDDAKAAGYTVAVLLIPYDPIVDPETIWNNEDGVVNGLIANNKITPAMQSCASQGYFFSAATSTDINNAMQTIFHQAVQSSRLTH